MITVEKTREVIAKCIKKYGDISMECLAADTNRDARWIEVRDFLVFVKTICITIAEREEMREYLEDENFCSNIEKCLKEWYVKQNNQDGSYKIESCPNVRTDFMGLPIYLQLCFIIEVLGEDPDDLLLMFVNVKYISVFRGEMYQEDMDYLKKFEETRCAQQVIEIYKKHFGQSCGDMVRLRRDYNAVTGYVKNRINRNGDPHRF